MENKPVVIPPLRLRRHKSFFTTNEKLYKNVNAAAIKFEQRPEVITGLKNFYATSNAPNSEKIARRLQLHLDLYSTNPPPNPLMHNSPPRPSPNLSHPPASPPRLIRQSGYRIIPISPPESKTRKSKSRRRKTRKQTNK